MQDLFCSFSLLKIDFCGLGTTLDIFQNIILLYFQYGVLVFTGYGIFILFPLWSLEEASDEYVGLQRGLDEMIKRRSDGALYYLDRIWVPFKGDVRTLIIDEAHKSKYSVHPGSDEMYYDLRDKFWWPRMKKDIVVYERMAMDFVTKLDMSTAYHPQINSQRTWKCRSSTMWAEVGEGHLIGPDLIQETTKNTSHIKDRLKDACDHQKSYADKRRKPLEFYRKLPPRFVGPFEITKRIGFIAYRLRLPEELNGVHDTFHMSNLKKYLADPTLQVPLDEIQVDVKLKFVEESVEILERGSRSLSGVELPTSKFDGIRNVDLKFTWEREDHMRLKYPHLFSSNSS
nr:hypothetical protein [Tanacetum cinerariifolium]